MKELSRATQEVVLELRRVFELLRLDVDKLNCDIRSQGDGFCSMTANYEIKRASGFLYNYVDTTGMIYDSIEKAVRSAFDNAENGIMKKCVFSITKVEEKTFITYASFYDK